MEAYLSGNQSDKTFTGTAYYSDKASAPEETANIEEIANSWVNGEVTLLDYAARHPGRRVPLPTYPFAKESYWMYSKEADFEAGDTGVYIEPVSEQKKKEETILERLSQAYESERLELIVDDIRCMFAKLLGFTEGRLPDVNEGYFSLGLESVETREAYNSLEERYNIELNDQVFFNYPSILKTSEYILSRIDFNHLKNTKYEAAGEEEEGTLVLSRKDYVQKDAVEGTFSESDHIWCICSSDCEKVVKHGFFEGCSNVLYVKNYGSAAELLNQEKLPDRVLIFDIDDKSDGILEMFEFIKQLQSKTQAKVYLQYYFKDREADYGSSQKGSVRGFLSTLQMEDVKFLCKEIRLSEYFDVSNINEMLKKEYRSEDYTDEILYTEQGRYVRCLKRMEESFGNSRFAEGGVYLITGGLGGIGRILSNYLCTKYRARLILTGRRSESSAEEILKDFDAQEGTVAYMQADASCREDLLGLANRIKEQYGHINGIIHAAGITKDARISNKNKDDFLEVLRPKVAGALNLDEAFKDHKLDLFILCSSIAAVSGNIGQADYCYANSFLNEFAKERNVRVARKERFGHTVAIDWPFWKDGGMKVDPASKKWMRNKFGLLLMNKEVGIRVLEIAAKTQEDTFNAMYGREEKIVSSFSILPSKDADMNANSFQKENVAIQEEAIKEEIRNMSFEELVRELQNEMI